MCHWVPRTLWTYSSSPGSPLLKTPPPCTLHPGSHGSTGRSQNTITSTPIPPPIISEPLHLLQVAEWLRFTKLVSRTFFATSAQVVHPSLWNVDAVGSHGFARKWEPQGNGTMKGPKLKSYYSVTYTAWLFATFSLLFVYQMNLSTNLHFPERRLIYVSRGATHNWFASNTPIFYLVEIFPLI